MRRPSALASGAAATAAAVLALVLSLDGCASCGASPTIHDGPHGSGLDNDAGVADDAGDGEGEGEGDVACAQPAIGAAVLAPEAGSFFYEQLGLGGLAVGESALLVGPDESVVLIDVGNDSHADDVIAAVDDVTGVLGLPAREVDDVILTHFHADHADGLAAVLDAVAVRGRVIFRGFVDVDTANPDVVQHVCDALASRPGLGEPVCEASEVAPCDPSTWTSAYRRNDCPGFGALALGSGARLSVVAASGEIEEAGGVAHAFEDDVGAIRTDDSNGENARSIVALIEHGPFRMIVAGDLTGGGSDTDAVEPYYAPLLASRLGVRGVDVMHASHHGRDTSSSSSWVAALLPSDGRARNVIMGVSTAHLGSPHQAVLDAVLAGDRLGEGRAWTTRVAAGGATDAHLVDAGGGRVIVKTVDEGRGYLVQAVDDAGVVIETRAFNAARCP